MTSQPKGHPWLVFTMFLATSVMLSEGATSFSPPSLSLSPTYAPVVQVIGKVYCYRCFNEAHPEESHGKMHLEGAMVKVTCQSNGEALVGFGYTKNNGKYSVILKGLPISNNNGADSCKVELHAAPGGSECNVPIELNLSGLSVYSKSNEGVVLKANQVLAYASKKASGCSKPHTGPPTHPYNSPQVPYHYPSPPFSYKSPPLPYLYSPPSSNQFPPPAYQFPSPPTYHQQAPPNSYPSPPESYNYPPPQQALTPPTSPPKFLPPPYYYNTPPPQHHYSSSPTNNVSPPLAYQYPPPPYKSPILPSSPATPHHYNSLPPYQYPPPPYNYQFSPPLAQYSPPLPPTVPKHVQPKVPHQTSPPASSASPQPLYQYNTPPPASKDISSTTPPLHSYQFVLPPNQLS